VKVKMERLDTCANHDELLKVAVKTASNVESLTEQVKTFLELYKGVDDRVRDLQINGARISQDNSKEIKVIVSRVDTLENDKSQRQGAEREAAKIGAIVGSVIGAAASIVTVGALLFFHVV